MCGGAVSGAVAALRQARAPFAVPVVANEYTADRRQALIDGYLTLVLATPLRLMAERLIAAAHATLDGAGEGAASAYRRGITERIPFELFTSENI